jgi:hypothetical protein
MHHQWSSGLLKRYDPSVFFVRQDPMEMRIEFNSGMFEEKRPERAGRFAEV